MTEIKDDVELTKFDGVTSVTVYKGGFDHLEKADLKWRTCTDEMTMYCIGETEVLKLSEIVEQAKSCMVTIFINSLLNGEIWQYGNYGDSWWVIGELAGYA